MLCKDDTLDKENVFMIFDELRVRNSPLQILFLWTQLFLNFFVHEQQTTSFLPALRVTDYSTTHAEHEQANKVVPVFIHVLNSRAL